MLIGLSGAIVNVALLVSLWQPFSLAWGKPPEKPQGVPSNPGPQMPGLPSLQPPPPSSRMQGGDAFADLRLLTQDGSGQAWLHSASWESINQLVGKQNGEAPTNKLPEFLEAVNEWFGSTAQKIGNSLTASCTCTGGLAFFSGLQSIPAAGALPVPMLPPTTKHSVLPLNGCADQPSTPKDQVCHVLDADAFRVHQMVHFLQIAEQCEQKGDWEMARNCYEEVARIGPESTFGTLATVRLAMIQMAPEGVVQAQFTAAQPRPQVKKEIVREDRMEPRRLLESFRMLQMGETYRLAGDLDNAFRFFQDSHAICPASRYGQAALDRMLEIDRVRLEQLQDQQRRRRVDDASGQELPGRRRQAITDDEIRRRDRAHAFFFLAESYLSEGDEGLAYNYYQEAHLAWPESYYGTRAIERMRELETKRSQGPSGDKQ